ncbi:MAG: TrkA family potassium uptake protein [Candidatus Omnitrophica bacterium]|nr:TrkA family potassium uptake protein [Candidatus Omnitrophota bacterium]
MYIIIVSGGTLGLSLAQRLLRDQHEVSLIDISPKVCQTIAETTSIPIIQGDATSSSILQEAVVEKADAIVALTSKDYDNIIISQIAKEKFGVKRAIAKVNNPRNLKIFSALGVDVPIDSTSILARIVEEEASFTDFVNLMSIKRGRLSIVRVDLSKDSPVVGRKIKDIRFPLDAVLVSILRQEDVIIPRGEIKLEAGDVVIAVANIEKEKDLINLLLGKKI